MSTIYFPTPACQRTHYQYLEWKSSRLILDVITFIVNALLPGVFASSVVMWTNIWSISNRTCMFSLRDWNLVWLPIVGCSEPHSKISTISFIFMQFFTKILQVRSRYLPDPEVDTPKPRGRHPYPRARGQNDWQTLMKILSCPKFRLRVVIIGFCPKIRGWYHPSGKSWIRHWLYI